MLFLHYNYPDNFPLPTTMRPILYIALILASALSLSFRNPDSERSFYDHLPRIAEDSPLELTVIAERNDIIETTVEARATLKQGREWGITVGDYRVTVSIEKDRFDDINTGRGGIRVMLTDLSGKRVYGSADGIKSDWTDSRKDGNTLTVTFRRDSTVTVSGGHSAVLPMIETSLPYPAGCTVTLTTDGLIDDVNAVVEQTVDPTISLATEWTEEALSGHFATTTAPLEGFWDYLDGDNDPRRAIAGGRYTLALVDDGAGGYTIIYVGGAKVESDLWRCGMVKGRLTPTIFTNHYDATWIDATFRPIVNDVSVTVEQGAILSVAFPHYSTVLRFSRRCR